MGTLPSEDDWLAIEEPTLGRDSSPAELTGGYVEFILFLLETKSMLLLIVVIIIIINYFYYSN